MKTLEFTHLVTHADIENIFELKVDNEIKNYVKTMDLHYRELNNEERDDHIFRYLKFLSEEIEPSGPKRKPIWDAGWKENLDAFKQSSFDTAELTPHYYRRNKTIMRFDGKFVLPKDASFEAKFLSIIHKILSKYYLREFSTICELGSGPLHNIVGFAKELKGKKFIATDWVSPPVEIATLIEKNKISLGFGSHEFKATLFDFNKPNGLKLPEHSIVLTYGSMEQLGGGFGNLLNFFMSQPAKEFLHIEPILELYDRSKLFDELAYQYSLKRNYLNGFYSSLHKMQSQDLIKIQQERKILGSGFHDGWTLIRWTKV